MRTLKLFVNLKKSLKAPSPANPLPSPNKTIPPSATDIHQETPLSSLLPPAPPPPNHTDSCKSARKSSNAPDHFELPKRTSLKTTVKFCKSLTFTTNKVGPPKFNFSLTPTSVRDVAVPSSPRITPLPFNLPPHHHPRHSQ